MSETIKQTKPKRTSTAKKPSTRKRKTPEDIKPEEVSAFFNQVNANAEEAVEIPNYVPIEATEVPIHITNLPAGKQFEAIPVSRIDDMRLHMYEQDIEITTTDKTQYLKSILHDTPVQLSVPFIHNTELVARSISVYETELLWDALDLYEERYGKDRTGQELSHISQQLRATLQVQSVDGQAFSSTCFSWEPGKTDRKADATKLLDTSFDIYNNISAPRWVLIIKSLNIFINKLAKLQSRALDQDFWIPGSTD